MKYTEVQEFLDDLPPATREVVEALRTVVRQAVPYALESLLWDGLSYHRPEVGGRVKGAVCQIGARKGQVQLGFIHGVRLADSSGLLQGDRLSKRFVPIKTIADAERPEIADLIREAAAVEWG
jgi:hypothetical protein